MAECWVNRSKFMKDFELKFGSTSPAYFSDMLKSHPYLKRAWDEACELDEQRVTVTNETIQGKCVFVTRDENYNVVKLSIAIHGGWDEYWGNDAQRKYDAITAPYCMAIYND